MCTSNVVIISLLDPIARIHLGKVAAGGDFPYAVFTEREQARHASAKNEMRVLLRDIRRALSCPRQLSVNVVAPGSKDSRVQRDPRTRVVPCCLTLSLLSRLACGLLIGRGDGTSGQAPVRVPIGADMTAAVATRRRAFQYSLMHRQNCENPETRGVITDTSWQARSTRYAHTVRETRRTRTRQVVCKGGGGLPLYALSIIVSRLNTACIPRRESRIRRGSPRRRSLWMRIVSRERKNDGETRAEKRKRTEKAARKISTRLAK